MENMRKIRDRSGTLNGKRILAWQPFSLHGNPYAQNSQTSLIYPHSPSQRLTCLLLGYGRDMRQHSMIYSQARKVTWAGEEERSKPLRYFATCCEFPAISWGKMVNTNTDTDDRQWSFRVWKVRTLDLYLATIVLKISSYIIKRFCNCQYPNLSCPRSPYWSKI